VKESFETRMTKTITHIGNIEVVTLTKALRLAKEADQVVKENIALKAVLAEVEKQTGQVREILRGAANNMAVLHHE
jgi:hypothetical protein